MARFDYKVNQRNKPVKAVVQLFNGGPGVCLAIKTDFEETVWFYADGEISAQVTPFDENDKDIVQKFYEGDSITITF